MNPNPETRSSKPKKTKKSHKNSGPKPLHPRKISPFLKKSGFLADTVLDEQYITPVPSKVKYGLLSHNATIDFASYLIPNTEGNTMSNPTNPPRPVAPQTMPLDVTEDLQDLLQDMIAFLIDDKAVVHITHAKSVNKLIFSVMVPPREMGKIIGKKGILIKSLGNIFKAMGSKYEKIVEIELVEPRITPEKVEG